MQFFKEEREVLIHIADRSGRPKCGKRIPEERRVTNLTQDRKTRMCSKCNGRVGPIIREELF